MSILSLPRPAWTGGPARSVGGTGTPTSRHWKNGVQIARIFVYTTMTAELERIIARQKRAGVQVGRVQAESLDPALRLNLAIWVPAVVL